MDWDCGWDEDDLTPRERELVEGCDDSSSLFGGCGDGVDTCVADADADRGRWELICALAARIPSDPVPLAAAPSVERRRPSPVPVGKGSAAMERRALQRFGG